MPGQRKTENQETSALSPGFMTVFPRVANGRAGMTGETAPASGKVTDPDLIAEYHVHVYYTWLT
jgi:hypothetical protein